MLTSKTMLDATAAIRDALINAETEDIAINFLHGSSKSDECDRLLSKVEEIREAIERHICIVSLSAAYDINNALNDADTAEIDAHGFDNADLLAEFSRLEKKAGSNCHALLDKFLDKLQPKTCQSEVVA